MVSVKSLFACWAKKQILPCHCELLSHTEGTKLQEVLYTVKLDAASSIAECAIMLVWTELMDVTGVALLTTSDATPNYGDGLCVLSALMFGVHKWRSETATVKFVENTQELVAIQLGTLALLANISESPKYLSLVHDSPGKPLPTVNY